MEIEPLVLHFSPAVDMTDNQFYEFCRLNRDLRIERTAAGDVVIMTPAGGETSNRNIEITHQLQQWAKRDGQGKAFDSSGGFRLLNGATRSPDAAWVRRSRLARLRKEEKAKFLPLCPDFVIELRSPTDALAALHAKMEEYLANGARLGWLIDPEDRRVYFYSPDGPRRELADASEVSGDPVLPGFVLTLAEVWEPGL
jgi:Uma2 family endonuclease